MIEQCDVLVVGAGPGGLAAAKAAQLRGAERVVLLERDDRTGGILNQCIHDGFGLFHYHETLTGPEYACRARQDIVSAGVEIRTGSMVTDITPDRLVTAISRTGPVQYQAGAIVIATGCRERTRGAIAIPGSRPAGILTAGVAQNLVNIRNIMVGKNVVILGSGDIGLIMARRLTLEGATVQAVIELMPVPGGLERNVSQCLEDFGIPLLVSHTVTRIIGSKRVTGVEIAKVDADGKPIDHTARMMPCDTLILSVGLIPENELARNAGVALDERTNGAKTDSHLQTRVPGIFVCGNARKVMDIADFVSEQGEVAGQNAFDFTQGKPLTQVVHDKSSRMAKGFPPANGVTCTICPQGCRILYRADGSLEGYGCTRGVSFAVQEKTEPRRTLTLTMKTELGMLVPMKTETTIPRAIILDVARNLNRMVLPGGRVSCGQRVVADFGDLKIDLVATDDIG